MSLQVRAVAIRRCSGQLSNPKADAGICRLVSGLAVIVRDDQPLILTTAEIHKADALVVQLLPADAETGPWLQAKLVSSVRIAAIDSAFAALANRGWRCAEDGSRGASSLYVHVLRASASASSAVDGSRSAGLSCAPAVYRVSREDVGDAWVGTGVVATSSILYGAVHDGSLPVAMELSTRGVISNVSKPSGLLLLDAQFIDSSQGGLVRTSSTDGSDVGCVVACLAPPLQSISREAVAFTVAIQISHVLQAVLSDRACWWNARDEKLVAALRQHMGETESIPRVMSSRSSFFARVREGVALLWLAPTGSWASAVVVSEEGHLITCAHFLTGSSWMEGEPEAAKVDHGSGTQHGQLPAETARAPPRRSRQPTSCSGRGKVRNPDGQVVEITFEADVLHIFEGYLDAALLRARLPLNTTTFWSSSAAHPDAMFMPLPWCSASSVPKAGLEVLAVGHGLFGPGTPWTGPAISTGHLCKVSHGTMTRRPAVLQSTTAVHRGCSGGALVATESGTFIGLVTTNVKHQDGTTMPRVNFSLPTMRLAPAFADFLKHGADDDALQQLVRAWGDCGADAQERGLWRLEPEPLWLPSRMEDRKKQALDRMKQLAADAEAAAASQDEDSTESSIATSSIKDSGNEDQSNPARPSAEAVASAHRWRRSRL